MTEVKICGVCRPEDARSAQEAGAHYIGVILSARSARLRSPDEAARIFASAPGLRRAGVFVDAPAGLVVALASRLSLDVVQLHGSESESVIEEIRSAGEWRIWKAIRVRGAEDFKEGTSRFAGVVDGVLLDAWTAHQGGAGVRFPWDAVAPLRTRLGGEQRLIVAGGLDADSVVDAIALLYPDVVDVSSGVEHAVGEKDDARVRAFVDAVRGAGAAKEA